MNRNLDGYYFRVKRHNDKYDNICWSDLSEDEMNDILKDKKVEWLKSLCIGLGKTIKNIGDQLDLVVGKN